MFPALTRVLSSYFSHAVVRMLFFAFTLAAFLVPELVERAFAAKKSGEALLPPLTSPLEFTVSVHGSGEAPTVLIIGGIQGMTSQEVFPQPPCWIPIIIMKKAPYW